ncbi:hypothetical protein ZWY2020_009338 [Hordeum vulgare]|nr:hypothetical protein ZWY2020_009338 [Hordeum vulgare]
MLHLPSGSYRVLDIDYTYHGLILHDPAKFDCRAIDRSPGGRSNGFVVETWRAPISPPSAAVPSRGVSTTANPSSSASPSPSSANKLKGEYNKAIAAYNKGESTTAAPNKAAAKAVEEDHEEESDKSMEMKSIVLLGQ